jgi:hypothetical protein
MYTQSERDIEDMATDVLTLVIQFLHQDGVLNDEQLLEYRDNYAIVARRPSFFRKFLAKITKTNVPLRFIVVKQCTLPQSDEPEEKSKTPILKLHSNKEKNDKDSA